MKLTADDLAEDIRRIDGNHDMGAGKLAEALFAAGWRHIATRSPQPAICETCNDHGAVGSGQNSEPCPACATDRPAKTYTLDELLDDLSPEHRAKVEKRFEELLADYNSQEPVNSPQPAKPAGAVHIFGVDLASGPDQQVEARVEDGKIVGMTIRDGHAGAVPMPERVRICATRPGTEVCTVDAAVAYGNAREAAAGGVAPIDPAELLSAYVSRCIAHHDDAPRDYRIAAMREALAELGVKPAADGLSLKSRPDFVAGYDAGVADEKLTQACNPAVEAAGTVIGYSSFPGTIEIWLDSGVPRWMIGDKIRVTISPTGGKSDA